MLSVHQIDFDDIVKIITGLNVDPHGVSSYEMLSARLEPADTDMSSSSRDDEDRGIGARTLTVVQTFDAGTRQKSIIYDNDDTIPFGTLRELVRNIGNLTPLNTFGVCFTRVPDHYGLFLKIHQNEPRSAQKTGEGFLLQDSIPNCRTKMRMSRRENVILGIVLSELTPELADAGKNVLIDTVVLPLLQAKVYKKQDIVVTLEHEYTPVGAVFPVVNITGTYKYDHEGFGKLAESDLAVRVGREGVHQAREEILFRHQGEPPSKQKAMTKVKPAVWNHILSFLGTRLPDEHPALSRYPVPEGLGEDSAAAALTRMGGRQRRARKLRRAPSISKSPRRRRK